MDTPIPSEKLADREQLRAEGDAEPIDVRLLDLPIEEADGAALLREDGRLRVVTRTGADGIDVLHPFPAAETFKLSRRELREHRDVVELEGHRPSGLPTDFTPTRLPARRIPKPRDDRDPGGTIFDTDDRYLFQDTSFPWRITGKVRTAGGWGSGTIIGPRHVLTASHVVNWTRDDDGSIGWLSFTPSYFDGRGPWGEISISEVIFWIEAPGSLTDQQTAFDYVVLVTSQRIGDTLGYAGYRTYDDDWNGGGYWQSIGYPGELSSGERPAFQGGGVISTEQEFSSNGRDGSVLGHFNDFTPGQSGGAVWGWWGEEPWPRVVGVGSTIGSTAVVPAHGSTTGDNEYGGGPALSSIISWARTNRP